jgi:4-amino-4-deoxy-L-arabinose transferase-like glycosyltransferase
MMTPSAQPSRATPPPDLYLRFALAGIGVVTLFRLAWLGGHPIDLYPDEAQYWIWAQHPAWGYYSKPPMVAWLIAATTTLFGEGDLQVKLAAPLTYLCTSILVFLIAARLYDRRMAAWSAIAFVTLPAVSISSVIISTDVPLLFCWALATYALIRAREPGGRRWWLLVGAAGGLGLLSKYAMGFWLGSAFALLVADRSERRHLRDYGLALLLALVIYAPNLVWNARHGFVSYRHTGDNAAFHGLTLHLQPFLRFAGSQFLVFGPMFLAAFLIALATGRRLWAEPADRLLLVLGLPTLAIMLGVAALSRAEPNWSAPTWLTLTIFVVAWLSRHGREWLVQYAVLLHVVMAVGVFGARDFAHLAHVNLPGQDDPLHRLRGWAVLGRSVEQVRLQYPSLPPLGDDRELMAELIYYMEPHPLDMAIWNPSGHVRNGFEMNQSLADHPGGDYLWITGRKDPTEILSRFESHDPPEHIYVPLGPGLAREVWVYPVYGFKGYAASGP